MSEQLQNLIDGLRNENTNLKTMMERLLAEKQVLRQTVHDMQETILNYKAVGVLMDNQAQQLKQQVAAKNSEVEELNKKLSHSNTEVTA